jgi:putative transposon-encoded protein
MRLRTKKWAVSEDVNMSVKSRVRKFATKTWPITEW